MELKNEPNVRLEQKLVRIIVASIVFTAVLTAVLFVINNLAPSTKTRAAGSPVTYVCSGYISSTTNLNKFDLCVDGDTVLVTGTLSVNANSTKLEGKNVIMLIDGGQLQYTSKRYLKFGSGGKILLANGGTLTATSGSQDKASCIFFGTTKQVSYTGEGAAASFADVNTAGGIQLSGFTALPVELIRFEATLIAEGVRLNWATASEINNSHFEIEKSTDGQHWNKIGSISGNGNSQKIIKYEYTDFTPLLSGNAYYRLKQIDYDGVFEYSFIRNVSADKAIKAARTSVYPNPANNYINVGISVPGKYQIIILDQSGTVKYQTETTEGQETINTSMLSAGIYYVKFVNEELNESHRIVIRH